MRTRPVTIRPAFTLIELVLVLVVIAIAVGVAAPSMRGWSRGSRISDTAEQLIALTRLARTQATATAQIYRVTLDTQNGRGVILRQDGQQFVEVGEGAGGAFTVPEGVTVRMMDLQNSPREFIEFYPNGRAQTARFEISMPDGYQSIVECAAPTESFHVARDGGTR